MQTEKPIQPVFTLHFQARYCIVMMVGSVLTSLLLYLVIDQGLGENYFESLMTLNSLESSVPTYLAVTFVIQIGLIMLITFTIHLFVSHKIAGPVYRYELTLASLLKDDFRNEVRTRQGDQLKSMVAAINRYIEKNRDIYFACRRLVEELDRQLEAKEIAPQESLRLVDEIDRMLQPQSKEDTP